jgi:hypothetical protein
MTALDITAMAINQRLACGGMGPAVVICMETLDILQHWHAAGPERGAIGY